LLFEGGVSLSHLGLPKPSRVVVDTHKLPYFFPLFFASASKEGCALVNGVEGFGPFGNP